MTPVRFGFGDRYGYEYGDGDGNCWKPSCGVAITPDGAYAYVTNYTTYTVSVISTATNTVTATVTVGSDPYGVAVTPNGAYVYVTNEQQFGFGDKHGFEYGDGDIPVGNHPLWCGYNAQRRIRLRNKWTQSVSVINTATNTITDTIGGFNEPEGVAVAPNGAYVYVTNQESNTVSVVSTSNAITSPTPASTVSPTASPSPSPAYTSTPSVPEFPTWVILPLFAVVMLISIVFIRKRIAKKIAS